MADNRGKKGGVGGNSTRSAVDAMFSGSPGWIREFGSSLVADMVAFTLRDTANMVVRSLIAKASGGKGKLSDDEVGMLFTKLEDKDRNAVEGFAIKVRDYALGLETEAGLSEADKKAKVAEFAAKLKTEMGDGKDKPAKTGEAKGKPEVTLLEVMQSWDARLTQTYTLWVRLLDEPRRSGFAKNKDHFAPLLAAMLHPFVPRDEADKRVCQLAKVIDGLGKGGKAQFQTWFPLLTPAMRQDLARHASQGRVTSNMLKSAMDMGRVPAPVDDKEDFYAFLERCKISRNHDTFIHFLDDASCERFRKFRDYLPRELVRGKLSNDRMNKDTAEDIFDELENEAGDRSSFDAASAAVAMDMLEAMLLDPIPAPPPDSDDNTLNAAHAAELYDALAAHLPPPKPTLKEQVEKAKKDITEITGVIRDAMGGGKNEPKLPKLGATETVDEYVARLMDPSLGAVKTKTDAAGNIAVDETPDQLKERLRPQLRKLFQARHDRKK